MATAPAPTPPAGPSAGALAGIGAIGNVVNAYDARRGQERMSRLQVEQTRQQVEFAEAVRRRQAAINAEEVQRQQVFAQGSAGLFDNSMGMFQRPAEASIEDASGQIAQLYRDYLSRPAPMSIAPEAGGATAEREANMRSQASADVDGEAGRLAAVQGFGQYMNDNNRTMDNNRSLAGLFDNFARGSAGVARARMEAEGGNFIRQPIANNSPSQLGDMFVGLASAYANRPQQVPETQFPLLPDGFQAPGGYGVRAPRPGGDYGAHVPANLGIGGRR